MVRALLEVLAQAAVYVLQSHLPDTTYWEIGDVDTEWMQLGRSEPQTAQEWEDFLAFSLDFISSPTGWDREPIWNTLNRKCEMVRKNQDTAHFQIPMERQSKPPLPQPRQIGELEETAGLYTWRRELTLTKMLGNTTLGDTDIDHELWCAKFRKWRAIHKILTLPPSRCNYVCRMQTALKRSGCCSAEASHKQRKTGRISSPLASSSSPSQHVGIVLH